MDTQIIIAGVPASIVIVALVQVAKGMGMPRQFAPVLSIGLGVVMTVAVQIVRVVPWLRSWWEALGAGLMLGLGACGLYSGSKAMIVSRSSGGKYRERPHDSVVVEHMAAEGLTVIHGHGGGEPPAQLGPGGKWQ